MLEEEGKEAGTQTEVNAKAEDDVNGAGKEEEASEETKDAVGAGGEGEAGVADKAGKGGKEGEGEEKDLKTLTREVDTLAKRMGDKDSHISALERENADLRKTKKSAAESSQKLPAGLSARFPKETEEIARLHLEGQDLEADDLSAQIRTTVYQEKIAKETEARDTLLADSQTKNKFGDFAKYEKAMKKNLEAIPLNILQAKSDYWTQRAYNTAVGADYLALKKEQEDAASGGKGKKVDAGAGASKITDSSGGEKNASEQLTQEIKDAWKGRGVI